MPNAAKPNNPPAVTGPSRRPRTYTIHEVAEHLSVSPRSVLDWIHDGRLAAMRLSARTIRILEDDLRAFIDAARQGVRK